MFKLEKPTPYVEIRVSDASQPRGYRSASGVVPDEFSLFTFFVEQGWISPEPAEPDNAGWQAAVAEIDIAEWAIYGLIRGVNRNSSLGSSNERSPAGDLLLSQRRHLAKGDGMGLETFPLLASAVVVGRVTVRIGWVQDEGDFASLAIAEGRYSLSDVSPVDAALLAKGYVWPVNIRDDHLEEKSEREAV